MVAALVCAWTAYADPAARERALAVLRPLFGIESPSPVKFGAVEARRTEADGRTILYVEGSLRNVSGRALTAPLLRVALIGDEGRPLYSWTAKPAKARLDASGESEFRTRLLSPPAAYRSIAISLAEDR